MKKHLVNILLVVTLLLGLSLLLYPTFSDYWNSLHQTRAITTYAETVSGLNDDYYEQILLEARAYNDTLRKTDGNRWVMDDREKEEYSRCLDVTGSGIMGYIEIQKINCFLPIYHGTNESVLQIAIGHVEGSSLPVGGAGTHCVLSGHRGLPSARLFTDLDKMNEGDRFVIRTMDEVLTYQVDQIRIVMPYELEDLEILDGQDLCTLVTCTPYGINTHRMLVRGHRVENEEAAREIRVTGDAIVIEPSVVAPLMAIPMLLVLLVILLVDSGRKKRINRVRRKAAKRGR